MTKPYIGICGVVNENDVKIVCDEFSASGYDLNSKHVPFMGIFANNKTIEDVHKLGRRYPRLEDFAKIFESSDKKVVHYINYYTSDSSFLYDQVNKLMNGLYHNELCRTVQLSIISPQIGDVKKIKNKFKDLDIILQISHTSIPIDEIVEKVKGYGSAISHVVIDPSTGRRFTHYDSNLLDLGEELKNALPTLDIGFAGGITPENVAARVNKISRRYGNNNYSISAEDNLRDKIGIQFGDDDLSRRKVHAFLQAASKVLPPAQVMQ